MDVASLAQSLTDWVVRVGSTVNDLPGTAAFGLGLFTWFAVEQILRRVMSGLRWVIIVGAIVALGLSVPYLASLMFERGGAAPLSDG
ncbi:hypothetical protein KUL25_08035 [Rhodobacteraceae bacterium N5(2021)]|uniref:Uncharacterized protein n=1 Tax=Gymnodinialimonas phycosphaerae TaxID=2841589 RepID=A0A975TXM2_9RHOB|nr:hypothetical protein [Gymnodinialimonas phycosphaerae]MBY4892712.1 hypothetical protein [Gymnodinialimonas phycosphaerae]